MVSLFLYETKGCGDYYVVTRGLKEGGDMLRSMLDKQNIKNKEDRQILSFKVLAFSAEFLKSKNHDLIVNL